VALHVVMLHVVVRLLVIDDVAWSVVMLTCQPRVQEGVDRFDLFKNGETQSGKILTGRISNYGVHFILVI